MDESGRSQTAGDSGAQGHASRVCLSHVGIRDARTRGAERGGVAVVRVSAAYEPPHRLPEMPGMPPIIHTYPNLEDVAAMQDVQAARKQADVVVVSWHWGVSPVGGGTGTLVGYQVEMGHAAVDKTRSSKGFPPSDP